MIKLFEQDLNKSYLRSIEKSFKNDLWVNGKIVKKFEENIQKKLKLKLKAIGCNSGSDALLIAHLLDRHPHKDIYITTPVSYLASSSIAKFLNLNLIYIDIEKHNYLLDLDKLENFLNRCEKKILKRIRGIINVELFGATNNLIRLKKLSKKYNLSLIGDCSQSIGSKFKDQSTINYYDYSVTSFYPTKLLSAYGDAGMVFVKKKHQNNALLLRNNGHTTENKNNCRLIGINSRLDSFQALILDQKLKNLKKTLNIKKNFLKILKRNLPKQFNLPIFDNGVISNNYILSFYVNKFITKKFINYMNKNGINCKVIYQKLLSENKVLRPIINTNLLNAHKIKKTLVSIPSHQNLSSKDFFYIINKIKKFKF